MNIFIFSFTKNATQLSGKLCLTYRAAGHHCTSYTLQKYADTALFTPLTKPLSEVVSDCFQKNHVLIFISACGIAVRSIAPYIRSKTTDPCVLVIDESGQYVISLLSGHIGGGNDFTRKTAQMLDATPIISTATDLNHCFAVDTFAKKNQLFISNITIAKKISASLLDHHPVGMSGFLPEGPLPVGLVPDSTDSSLTLGIWISAFTEPLPYPETLLLVPKQMILGIGCKRNTDSTALATFVSDLLYKHHIHPNSLAAIASIDLKKNEPAIVQLAAHYQVPFLTYDAQTLAQVTGTFTASKFVKQTTGVDNVCERACLAARPDAQLYLHKTVRNGMTLAIAMQPLALHYDEMCP